MVCLSGKRGYLCLSISGYGEAVIGDSAGEWAYCTGQIYWCCGLMFLFLTTAEERE
jgi:hypothetical protein